jgi:hypothetical protein
MLAGTNFSLLRRSGLIHASRLLRFASGRYRFDVRDEYAVLAKSDAGERHVPWRLASSA